MHQAGVGAPVFRHGGRPAGAVSMRLAPEDIDSDAMAKAAAKLQRTAYDISVDLGCQPLEVQTMPARY